MDLAAYKQRLERADWFYERAEGEAYYKGLYEMRELLAIAKKSPDHLAIFREVCGRNTQTNK